MSDTTNNARYRSRLNQLPLELKMKIGEISYQKGMLATNRKNRVIELLKDYNIPFLEVGTGTNRFIIKYDGYAIKIALDKEGIADNKQEWAISEELQPHAAYAWEISKGGHLLVASYIPAFTSYAEMCLHSSTIKKILKNWGQRYLLGDVGLSNINYANWGISPDGRPVCIDYAYIFPASMELFKCICGCKNMTFYDTTFSSYRCTQCGKKYEDRDLRTKISQKERLRLFENVQGIELTKEIEDKPIDAKYVKIDNDPDSPDPYDTAIHVAQMLGNFYD